MHISFISILALLYLSVVFVFDMLKRVCLKEKC